MTRQMRRYQIHKMADEKYCPWCGGGTEMVVMHLGMPGIHGLECQQCKNGLQMNYLESEDDLLDIPDSWVPLGRCHEEKSDTDNDSHSHFDERIKRMITKGEK